MIKDLGSKVKELRTSKRMTLKDLSDRTGLSTGFLSQLERGLTSIATDSLGRLADALEVDPYCFFEKITRQDTPVIRSYDRQVMKVDNPKYISYLFSPNIAGKQMMPRVIDILPRNTDENLTHYQHEGEEFIYVIEGILTLHINGEAYELYPGDGAHYNSMTVHNYANFTNKMVKILEVSVPNYFAEEDSSTLKK